MATGVRSLIAEEIAHDRELGELKVALIALEKRIDDRDQSRQQALWAALESLNRRLEQMNEFRSALSDQAATLITRHESEAARLAISERSEANYRGLGDKLDAELRPLHARIEELSRPNWTLLTSVMSIALVVIAGTYTIIGLKIDTAIAPNAMAIVALQEHSRQQDTEMSVVSTRSTNSSQADLVSQGDRSQLNTRLTSAEQNLTTGGADRRAQEAALKASLIEIETQFKSASMAMNIEKDATQQALGLLWARVYKEPRPPTHYRPNLYREN